MAYIGKTPTIGNFQKCDAITVVNGQAAYTMQVGGTNVSPESENHMLVSLNGILQAPVDSFTVSGSTITFASNLATGDVIDFIMLLGNVLDLGVPSDNTVSTAKIVDGAITSAKLGSGVGGKILQVKSATKTDTQSSTTQTYADVSDMSISITPSSTSSKILAFGYCSVAWDSANAKVGIKLVRDTTNILIGDSAGSRQRVTGFLYLGTACNSVFPLTFNYLDSPSTTSATTYKIQFARLDGAGTVYVNRSFVDTDNGTFGRSTSTITVMEVSA